MNKLRRCLIAGTMATILTCGPWGCFHTLRTPIGDRGERGITPATGQFKQIDLDARDIFPVRHTTATTVMGDGHFVLSPDRTMSLVCAEFRDNGLLVDVQFRVFRLDGTDSPILTVSARQWFTDQGTAPDPMSNGFSAVWSGDSEGFYLIGTPADCPNSSAEILYCDLKGAAYQVTHAAFLSDGRIVGSIPGTGLVVTQTLEITPETGLFGTRIRIVDPEGNPVVTFGEANGRCQFEDASDKGCVLYSTDSDRIYLGFVKDGIVREVGKGICPRFRPGSNLSFAFVSVDGHSLAVMEYEVFTGATRELARDSSGAVEPSSVDLAGRRFYQVDDLQWRDANTLHVLVDAKRVYLVQTE